MILVCDAGAPLEQSFIAKQLSPWRLKHITDIISDQSRALRVRSFINFSKNNLGQGLYIHIKESRIPIDNKNAVLLAEDDYNSMIESLYLITNPANARHLEESIRQLDGKTTHEVVIDE